MKQKVEVTLLLDTGTYLEETPSGFRYALCGSAVKKILKVEDSSLLPPRIKAVASLKPFKDSMSIWIRRSDQWSSTVANVWTWTKKQTRNDDCDGFFDRTQELLMTIISTRRRNKITPDNPLPVYYKITPL